MKRTISKASVSSNTKRVSPKQTRLQRVNNENEELNSNVINRHASSLGEMAKVSTRDNGSYNFFIPGTNATSPLKEINKLIYKEKRTLITLYKSEFMESRLFPLILLNHPEDCSQRETLRLCGKNKTIYRMI